MITVPYVQYILSGCISYLVFEIYFRDSLEMLFTVFSKVLINLKRVYF